MINHTRKFTAEKKYSDGLSIIILNLNKPELIIPLIHELLKAKEKFSRKNISLEILIGDTGSTDEKVLAAYEEYKSEITVFRGMTYNFSRCNNQVFSAFASKKYTLFLNNDIVFTDAYENISAMLDEFKYENTAIVGSYLFYPTGNVQHIGVDFFKTGEAKSLCYHPFHNQKILLPKENFSNEVPAVTGACLVIKSELFYLLDGFDENYKDECQDVHLCLSVRRLGFDIRSVYSGDIKHLENATRPKGSENWKDRRYFLRKWKSFIEVL